MKNKIKEAELTQFIIMNGGKLLDFDSDSGCYILESERNRKEWRLAFAQTQYPVFAQGMSDLLNLKKEANHV